MEVTFTQEWMEALLKEWFGKDAITSEDLEQIQYLRIGENFDNAFILEISKEEPPVPFSDPMGGDEWEYCTLSGELLKKYVEENITEDYKHLWGKGPYQISTSPIGYEHDEIELSEEDCDKAEAFAKTVCKKEYFNKMDDYKMFEEWYEDTCKHILDDIALMPNIQVLRVNGGSFRDFTFLDNLSKLKTLELVEVEFESTKGFEKLAGLEQLTCWMD